VNLRFLMVKPAPEDPDDQVPPDLFGQLPLAVSLLRKIPGPEREVNCLAEANPPIAWSREGHDTPVSYIILGPMFGGDSIESGVVALAPENREVVRVLFGEEWGASLSTGERVVVRFAYGLTRP
jgi:hypothetical protein